MSRYIIHFYCLAIEAGFYSKVVECLPVDPVNRVVGCFPVDPANRV